MSTNGHIVVPPILLTIAGFDPSCGAGTAADLKTFAAYGCYGVAAITSLTVQNTQGVEAVHNMSSAELRDQLDIFVANHREEINGILDEYNVPRVSREAQLTSAK